MRINIRLSLIVAVTLLLAAWPSHAATASPLTKAVRVATEAGGHAYTAREGYVDAEAGQDNGVSEAVEDGALAAGVVAYGVGSAALAGAGPLAGYAGMASAVSTLGLGGATTAVAGLLGSSATGAAATAVVTAAVGGPVVMGGILVVTTGAIGYGVYKGGQAIWRWSKE